MKIETLIKVKEVPNLLNHAGILFLATTVARVRGTKEINEAKKYYPDFAHTYENSKGFFVHQITDEESRDVRKVTQLTKWIICGPVRENEASAIDNEIFSDTLNKLRHALKNMHLPGLTIGPIYQPHLDAKYPQWKILGKVANYVMEWALTPLNPYAGRAVWMEARASVGEKESEPLNLQLEFFDTES